MMSGPMKKGSGEEEAMENVDAAPAREETPSEQKENGESPTPAVLNRAQRRAQEQGKKGADANQNPGLRPKVKLNGFSGQVKGGNKARFPRTGHK
jgi:hypothetical protein